MPQVVYIGIKGTVIEIFCLDAATGTMLWHNPLPGMGVGLVSIATFSGSTSHPAVERKHRDDDAANRSRPRVRCTCVQ